MLYSKGNKGELKAKIIAAGAAIPKDSVVTDDLLKYVDSEKRFGIPHDFISTKLGIIEKRIADAATKPSDLAIEASINALKQSSTDPKDIDVIIFCGVHRDWIEPSTAHRVQHVLGAKNAYCFDISNACHGMMNGLDYANQKIRNGEIETALICTGEKLSEVNPALYEKLKNPAISMEEFKLTIGALTVGDAGGALIIQGLSKKTGITHMQFYSAGEYTDLCSLNITNKGYEFKMDMSGICREVIDYVKIKLRYGYKLSGWSANDIDHFICHQVGKLPHALSCRANGIDINKSACTYPFLGNITTATIPVAMSLTHFKSGDKMLIQSSGSGICIGSTGLLCSYDNNINTLHSTLNSRASFKAVNCA